LKVAHAQKLNEIKMLQQLEISTEVRRHEEEELGLTTVLDTLTEETDLIAIANEEFSALGLLLNTVFYPGGTDLMTVLSDAKELKVEPYSSMFAEDDQLSPEAQTQWKANFLVRDTVKKVVAAHACFDDLMKQDAKLTLEEHKAQKEGADSTETELVDVLPKWDRTRPDAVLEAIETQFSNRKQEATKKFNSARDSFRALTDKLPLLVEKITATPKDEEKLLAAKNLLHWITTTEPYKTHAERMVAYLTWHGLTSELNRETRSLQLAVQVVRSQKQALSRIADGGMSRPISSFTKKSRERSTVYSRSANACFMAYNPLVTSTADGPSLLTTVLAWPE